MHWIRTYMTEDSLFGVVAFESEGHLKAFPLSLGNTFQKKVCGHDGLLRVVSTHGDSTRRCPLRGPRQFKRSTQTAAPGRDRLSNWPLSSASAEIPSMNGPVWAPSPRKPRAADYARPAVASAQCRRARTTSRRAAVPRNSPRPQPQAAISCVTCSRARKSRDARDRGHGTLMPGERSSTGLPCGVWRYACAQASLRSTRAARSSSPFACTRCSRAANQ
jgi:hypothetical protein